MRYPSIPKPNPNLARPLNDAVELFLASNGLQDVARTLEVHPGHLRHWLYVRPGHKGYTTFEIPKRRQGVRVISAPPNSIKILQNKFKEILDVTYEPKKCVFGFITGRSIADGASLHKKRAKWVLNIDLEDYYPTINFGRIRGLFIAMGIGRKAASIWAHLVTQDGKLPQGAPTSPVISNMICKQLDGKMMDLARRHHVTYTRYADDITLSTTKNSFPREVATFSGTPLDSNNVQLMNALLHVINSAGFRVNDGKTRLQSKAVRQEVTGLTVNEMVNVRRKFLRQIRAMIHAARKFGFCAAGNEYLSKYAAGRKSRNASIDAAAHFKRVVYGKLAFVRMIRGATDKCYVNLCLQMADIDDSPPNQIAEIKKMYEEFDVFICHASEDKAGIATPLYNSLNAIEVKTFVDIEYIKWGDSFVEKINHALSRAKLVVVVLSENSVDKEWPKKELNASLAREVEGRTKVLPLIVGTQAIAERILEKLPLLNDKLYKRWTGDSDHVAKEIRTLLS